jgi:hypothetical protein
MVAAYLQHMAGSRVVVMRPKLDDEVREREVVRVLKEDGISETDMEEAIVDIHMGRPFDLEITIGDGMLEALPNVVSHRRIHCDLSDPAWHGPAPDHHDRMRQLRNEVKFFSAQVVTDLLPGTGRSPK